MDKISSKKSFSLVGEQAISSRYVNVIRTDARFSTKKIRHHLLEELSRRDESKDVDAANLADKIKDVVHGAYAVWGETVIEALNDHAVYDTSDDLYETVPVPFHLYDARRLTQNVLAMAHDTQHKAGVVPTLVSLDDMITGEDENLQEVAFSRLFSMDGKTQYDYVPRPGYKSLAQQFEKLKTHIDKRRDNEGIDRVPLVLLEDNVRHAKMLNWLFQKMDEHGVLEHANVKEIVSCFCCASKQELSTIKSKGVVVPVNAYVEHKRAKVDVITPRDLFFDGFVIDADGERARLPGIFMDYASRFKVDPDKTEAFHKKIMNANMAFCDRVNDAFGVDLKIGWFAVSKGICHVTDAKPEDSMKGLLLRMAGQDQKVALRKLAKPAIKHL